MGTAVLAAALATLATAPATSGQAISSNVLETPRLDVAWLPPRGAVARLLVVDVPIPTATTWTVPLTVLERDRAGHWTAAGQASIGIPDTTLRIDHPWLVGLGPDELALVAPSSDGQRTAVVGLDVSDATSLGVEERWRMTIEDVIDDGGAADVDADGRPELVLASARTLRQGGLCQGSRVWVIDPARGTSRAIAIDDQRLAAGVTGRFDAVVGDDLAVYAYPNCPAGPDVTSELRLLVISLVDGTIARDLPASGPDAPPWAAPPARLDADGDGRHELLALGPRGLTVMDPGVDDSGVRVASAAAIPLGSLPSTDTADARVAWLEPEVQGRGLIGTERIRRDEDGVVRTGPATIMWDPGDPSERWLAAMRGAAVGAVAQAGPVVLPVAASDADCTDLLAPLAVVRCSGTELEPGPAWLGTRPLGRIADAPDRRLLVASGIDWSSGAGPPAVPSPWAGGLEGRWRHGPSSLFVLAELDADDVGLRPPTDRPTVDRQAHPGPVARIGADPGTRLITTIDARVLGAIDLPAPTLTEALSTQVASSSVWSFTRIPVATGATSGAGRATVDIPVGDARLVGGEPAERWAMTSVAIDDRGEPSDPVTFLVTLDVEPPEIVLDVPAVTPIWPITATLTGRVDPDATVELVGGGPVAVDRDGRFTIETPLAPWPQDVVVAAEDPFGNRAEHVASVVGGVDYRPWPWAAIVAGIILIGVVTSGLLGRRRGRWTGSPASGSLRPVDDGPAPELEELAPGEGLGARSRD